MISHSKVPRVRTFTYVFRGHRSTPLHTLFSISVSLCIFCISTSSSVGKNIPERGPKSFAGCRNGGEPRVDSGDGGLVSAARRESSSPSSEHPWRRLWGPSPWEAKGLGGPSRSTTGCPVSWEQLTNLQGLQGAPCQGKCFQRLGAQQGVTAGPHQGGETLLLQGRLHSSFSQPQMWEVEADSSWELNRCRGSARLNSPELGAF